MARWPANISVRRRPDADPSRPHDHTADCRTARPDAAQSVELRLLAAPAARPVLSRSAPIQPTDPASGYAGWRRDRKVFVLYLFELLWKLGARRGGIVGRCWRVGDLVHEKRGIGGARVVERGLVAPQMRGLSKGPSGMDQISRLAQVPKQALD